MASIWSISLDDAVSLVRAVPGRYATDGSELDVRSRARGVRALRIHGSRHAQRLLHAENCRTGNDDIVNSVFI